MFVNHVSDKGMIIPKIYFKNSCNSIIIKQTQLKNKQRTWTFFQKDIAMANKHVERCSITTIIRETELKTNGNKNQQWATIPHPLCCGDVGTLVHCCWGVEWCIYGK